MAHPEGIPPHAVELPCTIAGARAWELTSGPDSCYIPYFYNPPLDPEGRRLVFVRHRGGVEQACLLDLEHGAVTQLTDAHGHDQHWAPYIRTGVAGIRPQFVSWSQPDWRHVLYWEGQRLCRVDVDTHRSEELFVLPEGRVPAVLHCSPQGWVCWGYLPADRQAQLRGEGVRVDQLERELADGCGFMVFDHQRRELVCDVPTPFWPNHVSASPDHRWILYCHEGSWDAQRMYLFDVAQATSRPLRVQDDGAAIGHEFWMDAGRVGYHGRRGGQGFFGVIDVDDGDRVERRCVDDHGHYGHYHASPDGGFVVTDGEATPDSIAVAPLVGDELRFEPVCRHGWARDRDQRYHPHPHWHAGGRRITFTGCRPTPHGDVRAAVLLLELPPPR